MVLLHQWGSNTTASVCLLRELPDARAPSVPVSCVTLSIHSGYIQPKNPHNPSACELQQPRFHVGGNELAVRARRRMVYCGSVAVQEQRRHRGDTKARLQRLSSVARSVLEELDVRELHRNSPHLSRSVLARAAPLPAYQKDAHRILRMNHAKGILRKRRQRDEARRGRDRERRKL
eukprot:scaffold2534_cov260-Pinguiococcus_pyrenoidosus.AAC.9